MQFERAAFGFPICDALGADAELGGEGLTSESEAGAEFANGGGAGFEIS
ncbi:MAG: hypothetical protein RLZZ245_2999 [Verrucomicrobiota bacterium]